MNGVIIDKIKRLKEYEENITDDTLKRGCIVLSLLVVFIPLLVLTVNSL